VSRRAASRRVAAAALAVAAPLLLWQGMGDLARGERTQHGSLIVSLDGGLSPLKLPRDRTAPVTVRLDGGLRTADGSLLPRVTEVELALPEAGVLSSRGLPVCGQRRLRDATSEEALANCGGALVGRGHIEADVLLPNQQPFAIRARLLAFNGRAEGRRAVLLHAFATKPPTVVVLPFVVRRGSGKFATALVADLPPSLGPWPHFAHFEMSLGRRYAYRGRERGFISASCPIPKIFTAGFIPFARATYTLVDGRRVSTEIARGCRAGRQR
jgi:hypothetical protein